MGKRLVENREDKSEIAYVRLLAMLFTLYPIQDLSLFRLFSPGYFLHLLKVSFQLLLLKTAKQQ
jgi:hypothetical protein